jgi:hypothetical protein
MLSGIVIASYRQLRSLIGQKLRLSRVCKI